MTTPVTLIANTATAALTASEATSVANLETTVQDAVTVLQNITPAGGLIAQLYGANMNATTDQTIPLIVPAPADGFMVRHIVVTNASTSLTTAAGGVYPAASKGGTAIVANTQIYTTCTAATKVKTLPWSRRLRLRRAHTSCRSPRRRAARQPPTFLSTAIRWERKAMAISASKLLTYGSVCYIPAASFDAVSANMTWQGQTIVLLEPSEELPGFYGWFTLSGMTDPGLPATDPGLNLGDDPGLH